MQRFRLIRFVDSTGYSGTGSIVEGIIFSNGSVVIRWLTETSSIGIYDSIESFLSIHGHGGNSVIEIIDITPFVDTYN